MAPDRYEYVQDWLWRNRALEPRDARRTFQQLLQQKVAPRMLELTYRRLHPYVRFNGHHWARHAREFVRLDAEPHSAVDLWGDIHQLASLCGENRFDAILAVGTFEHLLMPWVAAHQIAQSLDLGGIVLVETVQSYPIHLGERDYWRFSTNALELLFHASLGMRAVAVNYAEPCKIVSKQDPNTERVESYLGALVCAVKVDDTPPSWPVPPEVPNQ